MSAFRGYVYFRELVGTGLAMFNIVARNKDILIIGSDNEITASDLIGWISLTNKCFVMFDQSLVQSGKKFIYLPMFKQELSWFNRMDFSV